MSTLQRCRQCRAVLFCFFFFFLQLLQKSGITVGCAFTYILCMTPISATLPSIVTFRGPHCLHPAWTFVKRHAGNSPCRALQSCCGPEWRLVRVLLWTYPCWRIVLLLLISTFYSVINRPGCLLLPDVHVFLFPILPLPLFRSLRHLWDQPAQRKTRKPIGWGCQVGLNGLSLHPGCLPFISVGALCPKLSPWLEHLSWKFT